MRLIESFTDEHRPSTGLPRNCLVEDDDGLLILILEDPIPLRAKAKLSEVQMTSTWDGEQYHHVLTERPSETFLCQVLQRVVEVHLALDEIEEQRKLDAWRSPFVSIHTHSEYSPLDGLSKIPEILDLVEGPGVFITDHGTCAGHAELQVEARKRDLFGGCGLEAYWVPDRLVREDQFSYRHLILLAQNQTGLQNLWAASTEANHTGFYGKPRLDWDLLKRYSEGLICSTACLRGPLSDLLLEGRVEEARAVLGRFMDIFGDRLYLELHTTHVHGQEHLNRMLVDLGQEMGLPLLAAVDSHYPCSDDYDIHQLWIKAQISARKGAAKSEGGDDDRLFSGRQDYHMMTRDEVRQHLSYLPASIVDEAVDNTVALLQRCTPYDIVKQGNPMYAPEKGRKYATDRLLAVCRANWDRKITQRRHSKPEEAYVDRFVYEMNMLIDKNFTDYFMIVHDYTRWTKDQGILVGPGRGSGAASLVAYLADITEVDPVEYDLPFARFLTVDREDPPDFDLDFPATKRSIIQGYVTNRWGFDNVMRVGTHTRLRNKGAIKDMARVLNETAMAIDYADIEAINKIIDDEEKGSAGLGYPWEHILNSQEDALAPYIAKYPALFDAAGRVVGRLRSYGRHAAGMVISTTEPLTGKLPMRKGAEGEGNDQMIAEFDYRALEALGLLKFDILTLSTLDTLQNCIDLIRQRRGISIDFYEWQDEFDDPQVWEALADGSTLGVFTFETTSMTELVRRIRPDSIAVLAATNALGRPGPMRSGATELFIRRRAGREEVVYDHPLMEQVVSSTYGLILFQEQVMRTTQVLAGFSDAESEKVRKILGKKLKDQAAAKGEEFVRRAWETSGVEEPVARRIWDQMATFSLYGFNLAHSVCYAMLGYYCAWFRVHYPEEFFTSVLSVADKDRVPEFVSECKKLGFAVLPPDVNESKVDFTAEPLAVRYGLTQIKGVGTGAAEAIVAHQPYASFEEFREKTKGTDCNMGVIKTLASVGAFDSIYPNRKELEKFLAMEVSGEMTRCVHKDPKSVSSMDFICHFDWESEPVELTTKGKAKKRKPAPKRCTTACRHYTPSGLPEGVIDPYTPAEIREKEMEHLGVWLTSTPFDRIPVELWEADADGYRLYRGSEVSIGNSGTYTIPGIPKRIKKVKTRTDEDMAFVDLLATDEAISIAVFPRDWAQVKPLIQVGKLGIYEIFKKDRKYSFKAFTPISD